MKICLIGTNIFAIPLTGYGGLEQLVYLLAVGLKDKGHQVAVVAPNGSNFPETVELIPTEVNEDEEKSVKRYQARLEADDFDVIIDASWQRWATMVSAGHDPQLPIINWHHTDPSCYQMPAPVRFPMWTGISRNHAENLSRYYSVPVKHVYNGIDLQYYQANGRTRSDRYLWMARWTPEKGGAEIIELAQRAKAHVDMYGDTKIIGSNSYRDLCFSRADGIFAIANPGITREATVETYSTHKALLQWYNWNEPFGLNICEAMACGCVPIVARRGSMPELIKDGETGFLCDTIDDMMQVIMQNKIKDIDHDKMRKHVEQHFSLSSFTDNWERLLMEVSQGLRW